MQKLFLTALLFSIFLFSCTKKTPLKKLICDTDVVKLYLYSGEAVLVHYESNDIRKVQDWLNYIMEDTAVSNNDCFREGRLVFKIYDDSTEAKFSLLPGCQTVTYQLKGIQYENSLSQQGIAFIEGLMKIQ